MAIAPEESVSIPSGRGPVRLGVAVGDNQDADAVAPGVKVGSGVAVGDSRVAGLAVPDVDVGSGAGVGGTGVDVGSGVEVEVGVGGLGVMVGGIGLREGGIGVDVGRGVGVEVGVGGLGVSEGRRVRVGGTGVFVGVGGTGVAVGGIGVSVGVGGTGVSVGHGVLLGLGVGDCITATVPAEGCPLARRSSLPSPRKISGSSGIMMARKKTFLTLLSPPRCSG
jgi:hypothetical protein